MIASVKLGIVCILTLNVLTVFSSRTNFVIMMADDLGYADVDYNGSPGRTANIASLATSSSSFRFNNFHSASSVCSPTRSALLTGRAPERDCVLGANRDDSYPIRAGVTTMAQDAERLGYRTAFFGKWHLGSFKSRPPVQKGFQNWTGSDDNLITYDAPCFCNFLTCRATKCSNKSMCLKGPCRARATCYLSWIKSMFQFKDSFDCQMSSSDATGKLVNVMPRHRASSSFIAEMFDNFTRSVPSSTPILVYVAFNEPHMPYIADPSIRLLCETDNTVCDKSKRPFKSNSRESNYFGVIYTMDLAVGRIRDTLKATGRLNDTFLIFNSDNGPEDSVRGGAGSAFPFRGMKRSLYEGGHRVAAFLHWPARISRHYEINALVSNLDLRATVLDVLKLENAVAMDCTVPPMDGVSFLPMVLSSNPVTWTRTGGTFQMCSPILAETPGFRTICHQVAYYEGDFKVMIFDKSEKDIRRIQLFNITADQRETKNLASSLKSTALRLAAKAKQYRTDVVQENRRNCGNSGKQKKNG